MADSTEHGPVTFTHDQKAILLKGQINWKIHDFLDWAKLKKNGYVKFSPICEFYFPEVNKSYKFYLYIHPTSDRTWRTRNSGNDNIGIFLRSCNKQKVNMKFSFSLLNSEGIANKTHTFISTFTWLMFLLGSRNFTTHAELAANQDKLLAGGCLHLQSNFTIFYTGKGLARSVAPITSSPDTVQQSMERFLTNPILSDFKIVCGGESFHCHKVVLANKSEVLEKMVRSDNWEENKENILEIEDFHPDTVRQMVRFIYTSEIPAKSKCSVG
jgi:hypothetical protein